MERRSWTAIWAPAAVIGLHFEIEHCGIDYARVKRGCRLLHQGDQDLHWITVEKNTADAGECLLKVREAEQVQRLGLEK